ncbi:MAG: deoxyribodipyrimidine photolyase [Fuerstiella sp.]
MTVSSIRIVPQNDAAVRPDGDFVLYWMIANRRLHHNFALQRAVERAVELTKPLLILEALRCGYKWASVRLHRFVLQGMADNRAAAASAGVSYLPYVEPAQGKGSGLLQALSQKACLVVTDDFPCFFLPRMVQAAAGQVSVLMEAVDSNGLYPMRATDRVFTRAFSFRNHLQKTLQPYLSDFPTAAPLKTRGLVKKDCIPKDVVEKWPAATDTCLAASAETLAGLPIDQTVGPALLDGGTGAARRQLRSFIKNRLHRYADDRNQPDDDPSSGLSPYLHFGHISANEVFSAVADSEEWSVSDLGSVKQTKGSRSGWWQMSPAAESFLDELITWRELGYNACCHDPNYDQYESLPEFARITLEEHANDPRPYIYSYEELRDAETHDDIWNAAQTQLVTEGRMHNYLRMLWGKKILEWTETPQQALDIMVDLNNRYAVDGRNPNSWSGIFWVLGRYDRAWGPERPIFGKIRYMTSDSTRRKLRLNGYLKKYQPAIDD